MLDEGEELTSSRVVDAAGPGAVVMYHAVYERGGGGRGRACRAGGGGVRRSRLTPRRAASRDPRGAPGKANPRDEPYVADLIPLASAAALTGPRQQVAEWVGGLAALGVTEVVYQPAGSDIERELRAFASATGLSG